MLKKTTILLKRIISLALFALIFLSQSSPQKGEELDPKKPDAQFTTSLTHFTKGEEEQALKIFFEALHVSISDREKELAIDGAIKDWNTLLKTKPSAAIYTTLWFLNKAKEQPTTKETLSKMGTLDLEKYLPEQADSKLLYIMGSYYSLQKNWNKADEYLQKSYDHLGGWLIQAKIDSDYEFYFKHKKYARSGIEARIKEENKKPKLLMQNGHTGVVNHIAYSPDGKTLATASSDNTAKIWSIDGKLLYDLKGHMTLLCIYLILQMENDCYCF
ncbi:MAG: hypothetical protein IPG24_19660 [Leptospiraceae bacterium]|nr:hypothetical protein [Leptospiraceae bacterium]